MTATAAIRKKRRQGSRAADLTEEQQAAYVAAADFIEGDDREMVIAGAAGTGKTTVIGHVVKALVRRGLKVAITAPTNKAVGVLSQKTREAVGDHCPNVWVGTIHALLGLKPELDERHGRQFLRQSGRPKTEEGMVIVVDECSMVDQNLLLYIRAESAKIGAKVLYVGDWYQLPPVFERASMTFDVPLWVNLTQVIRQAKDNPILSLATEIREVLDGAAFPVIETQKRRGLGVEVLRPREFERALKRHFLSKDYDTDPNHCRALCWTNGRVHEYNQRIRRWILGEEAKRPYVAGEVVSAVRPIVQDERVLVPTDGYSTILEVVRLPGDHGFDVWELTLDHRDEEILVHVPADWEAYKTAMGDLARAAQELQRQVKDRGKAGLSVPESLDKERRAAWRAFFEFQHTYADLRSPHSTTVHKSQGSTYQVAFIDLTDIGRNTKSYELTRLLYVAITRAAQKVFVTGELPARLYACEEFTEPPELSEETTELYA